VGWLFDRIGLPVAWLLGPMVAGVGYAGFRHGPRPLPPGYQMVGQALLGLSSGVSFPLSTLLSVGSHAVALVLVVVFTAGLSLLNGYLLWRWAGIDRATGFMGSLPGAASSMVAMSDEMGADAVTVAILQYLRMLLVVFLAPLAVGWLFPPALGNGTAVGLAPAAPAAPTALNLLLLASCGVVGAAIGRSVHLPSPTFLGPFLASLLLSWTLPLTFHLPSLAFSAGLLLMGISIGVRFDVPLARRLGRAALIESALVVVLIGASLAVGYAFHLATGVSAVTAVLGSTPGGMEVMVATAVEVGGDSGLVLAMQMVRWFMILLAGPWVAVRLVRQ